MWPGDVITCSDYSRTQYKISICIRRYHLRHHFARQLPLLRLQHPCCLKIDQDSTWEKGSIAPRAHIPGPRINCSDLALASSSSMNASTMRVIKNLTRIRYVKLRKKNVYQHRISDSSNNWNHHKKKEKIARRSFRDFSRSDLPSLSPRLHQAGSRVIVFGASPRSFSVA